MNAVEWLGVRLKLGPIAVGTVLAAVGTALPASVVTFPAVLFGGRSGKDIGIGAALGGPPVVAWLRGRWADSAIELRGPLPIGT